MIYGDIIVILLWFLVSLFSHVKQNGQITEMKVQENTMETCLCVSGVNWWGNWIKRWSCIISFHFLFSCECPARLDYFPALRLLWLGKWKDLFRLRWKAEVRPGRLQRVSHVMHCLKRMQTDNFKDIWRPNGHWHGVAMAALSSTLSKQALAVL